MQTPRFPHGGSRDIAIATNNGDIGGGEVMMLRIADALRTDGYNVTIVAPSEPSAVAEAAAGADHRVKILKATNRVEWMLALRWWDARSRIGMLWCNGLVPAVATAGHRGRIVHLHQRPEGAQKAFSAVAQRGAAALFVPSRSMLEGVPSATVMPNWTDELAAARRVRSAGEPFVVGFLGRVSTDKGINVLSAAMKLLEHEHPGRYRLAIGGESRFVDRRSREQSEAALASVAAMTDRLGWVDPRRFFDQIDLLVVPSVWPEPFGLVAAEAMGAQVPVLVSDAGALPEVVGHQHPLVVRAGDARALADAIAAVYEGRIRPHIAAQYERWQCNFSPEAGARRMQRLMADVSTSAMAGAGRGSQGPI